MEYGTIGRESTRRSCLDNVIVVTPLTYGPSVFNPLTYNLCAVPCDRTSERDTLRLSLFEVEKSVTDLANAIRRNVRVPTSRGRV